MFQAEVLLLSLLLFVVLYNTTTSGGNDCSITISSLYYKNEPILIRGSSIAHPTDDEEVLIPSGESLRLACPGDKNAIVINGAVQDTNILTAECEGNGQFKLAHQDASISKITCKNTVDASIHHTHTTCAMENYEFNIGFQVNGEFITTISGCYSDVLQQPLYVKHNISKSIAYGARNVPRPFWNDEDKQINNLYSRQREIVNKLVGLPESDDKYIKNGPSKYRLSRGHLAAKGDFIYGSQQRATFFISNSSPQWLTNNDANWRYIEESIRDLAASNNKDYEIYTGTYGVTTLPKENSKYNAQLFLKPEGQVPVPEFFWKVVRDPTTSEAAAFVVYNNPYTSTVRNTVCEGKDVCDRIMFLDGRIRTDDYVGGFTVCCTVEDFRVKVNTHLPEFSTTGLLTS